LKSLFKTYIKSKKKRYFFLFKNFPQNAFVYRTSIRINTIKKHFNKKQNINTKLIANFTKRGLKLKGVNILASGIANFYSLFYLNTFEKLTFSKYLDFFIFSKSDNNFFKRSFIFD